MAWCAAWPESAKAIARGTPAILISANAGHKDPVVVVGRMRCPGTEKFEAGVDVTLEHGDLGDIDVRDCERLESWVLDQAHALSLAIESNGGSLRCSSCRRRRRPPRATRMSRSVAAFGQVRGRRRR
jgi:hypothetical protein